MKSEPFPVGTVLRRRPLPLLSAPESESFDGRARCATHGFLLQAGRCARCTAQHAGNHQRRLVTKIALAVAALVVVGLGWRGASLIRETLELMNAQSARAASDGTQTSARVLVVYTTWGCPYCRRAKSWLSDHDVPYVEKHVDTDEASSREFHRIGGSTVPTFVVDGVILQKGFDAQDPALEQHLIEKGILRAPASAAE